MENRSAAIELMNKYGKDKIPFLFVIDFEMMQPRVFALGEIDNSKILFNVNGKKNYVDEPFSSKIVSFKKEPVIYQHYFNAFNLVMKNILSGNTYLCNLTFPTKVEINLSLKEIFFASRANYKLFYDNLFTVFSPECFVKIINGKIYSFPMKGTIDASIPNAREKILNDEKELAEHTTIVDLIRNDLSIVSENVVVEEFRYVEEIATNQKNLLQVSSRISGELPSNYHSRIGEIIFNLLPAGSISGAPKKRTVEIIKEAESYNRGYYTGVFGIFDGKNVDSAVMIRFIEKDNDQLIYKSGGGITFQSNPLLEYQELIDKVYLPIKLFNEF
jgi:para-aminobenzoate synthetase component 1